MKNLILLDYQSQKYTEHSLFFHFCDLKGFAKQKISAILIKQQ